VPVIYAVVITDEARKWLRAAPKAVRRAIGDALWRYQQDRSGDVKKLAGQKPIGGNPVLRLRVGDYRIIHTVDHGKVIIMVIDIGDRKDVYRE
jgi:mRNA interferase RelE/StbE